MDQIEGRVYFVFSFAWRRREELLQLRQVRAAEHEKHITWFYSAHPVEYEFGHWGDETTVWGLSFNLRSADHRRRKRFGDTRENI